MNTSKHLSDSDKLIPACEIYIVYNNSEVLMFKRSADSKLFPNYLIGPGGHIDEGEDPMSAVIRETFEETGITLTPEQITLKVLSFHHHLNRGETWIEYIFRADVNKKPQTSNTAEGTSLWVDINDLEKSENIFPTLKPDLEHILSASSGVKYSASSWEDFRLVKENTNISN